MDDHVSTTDSPGAVIGRRIRRAREQRRWTQTELAKLAGIPTTYVNKVEHGRIHAPSGDYLDKLARVLGQTTDDLIRGQAPPPADDDELLRRLIERRVGDRAGAELVEAILDKVRDLKAVDQHTVLSVVDTLLRTLAR